MIPRECSLEVAQTGGQDVYHRTHPFFFTSRSVFVVLWNPRERQDMHAAVEEFVQTVQTRAPYAKVVFVSTHADEGISPHGVHEALASFGLQGARHFHVSCKDGSGIEALIKHLRELALSLPHVEQRVPLSYIGLERVLKGLGQPAGAVPMQDVALLCATDRLPVDIGEDEVHH
jgi:internalin A